MNITAAAIHPYRLPLRASWLTATGGFGKRQGWLLRLDGESGARGYGDCAPLPGKPAETPVHARSRLGAQARRLIGMSPEDALQLISTDFGDPGDAPAARLAVETALLDLAAQAAGRSLAAGLRANQPGLGQPPLPTDVAVNAALGSLAWLADESVRTACAAGFRVLKLKLGVASIDDEIARLRRVAALLPPGVQLRLDANCAWNLAAAESFLHACADLPIEMLEEPLAQPTLQQLHRLQAQTKIAIGIDESASLFDAERLMDARPVRRLVIKPTRCGGLLAALALAQRALGAGLECVTTSSIESACGVIATAHLAAAIDNRLAHGLATSTWLAADTGPPPAVVNGRLLLPSKAGLGFAPHRGIVFSPLARRAPG
ncbi:enolase C-terminal domain-like protein [Candidatus Accumulibacter sp. ACC005]|jgi:o-succinylbenzoate synthase|uniref:mandelate racemase/muconate lactonizing enzyme family protein n=1 Tax=Candidatus Accumulibacter sp. ACC005 TaxID=2823331 RepID=UPI0025C40A05|nr:enolase C-terminal domain-like protein [Candidatus Accumulibacter sp. ACC005]